MEEDRGKRKAVRRAFSRDGTGCAGLRCRRAGTEDGLSRPGKLATALEGDQIADRRAVEAEVAPELGAHLGDLRHGDTGPSLPPPGLQPAWGSHDCASAQPKGLIVFIRFLVLLAATRRSPRRHHHDDARGPPLPPIGWAGCNPPTSITVIALVRSVEAVMIAKGSNDETEARRHIALLQGMIRHWNVIADEYRDAARGRAQVSAQMQREADRTHRRIREALELCDRLIDNLPPGHDMRRDLFQIEWALQALSESIAISAEQMGPRIEASRTVAGLRYLLSALRQDAGLGA